MQRHIPLLCLLALFGLVTLATAHTLPPLEGSDEPLHVAYTLWLRENRTLPERTTYLENCTRQQSGQPPLMYWLGARLLDLTRTPSVECAAAFGYTFEETANAWARSPDPTRRDDNNRNALPLMNVPPPDGLLTSVGRLRLLSVGFGMLAVLGAWLAAGEVFTRTSWRLTATVIFALTPTLTHISSYYTNDTPAVAFATLILWRALVVVRRPVRWWGHVFVGLLIGLGGLAKVSVLLVALVYVVAIWRGAGRLSGSVLAAATLTAASALGVFGGWAVHGLLAYNDPFGTGTHVHPVLNYDPPLGVVAVARGLPEIWRTYVGLLGYANVYLPPTAYALLGGLGAVAALGLLARRWGAPDSRAWSQALVLGLAAALVFIGFLRFYRVIFAVTGRLLLPAHLVYAVGIAAGLRALAGRVGGARVWQTAAACICALCAVGYSFSSLAAAYIPNLNPTVPPLSGPAYTFDDTVRLMGYHVESEVFGEGLHTITLCWEVLAPTDRLAAYAVRYVRDGVPVAQRTTVHGLGNYNSTLWQAGAVFCDAVDMPVGDATFGVTAPEPGAVYDVLVVLLDAQTGAVNWVATAPDGTLVPFPVLGQVRYGGPNPP